MIWGRSAVADRRDALPSVQAQALMPRSAREALTSRLKVFLNRFHLGKLTYGLLTVAELFRAPFVSGKVELTDGREFHMKNIIFTAAMNFPCEGGGVPMAPSADAHDGKLSACLVYGIPRFLCLCAFPFLIAGKHENIRGFEIVEAEELHVVFDQSLWWCMRTVRTAVTRQM